MVAAINNETHSATFAVPMDQAFYDQGRNLFNSGNHDAAWASFNEAIKLNSKEWMYVYMRGACSSCMGHYKAALLDYNTALSLCKTNDDRGWCHFDLAILYNLMGDEKNALSHLVTAAQLGNGIARNLLNEAGIPW